MPDQSCVRPEKCIVIKLMSSFETIVDLIQGSSISWDTSYQLFANLYFVFRHNVYIMDFFANWTIISILSDKSALMLGVCMDVFRLLPIVSITALFSFIKCVNAVIETVCMNRKTSMQWPSITADLSVVLRWLFSCQRSPWYKFVVSGNKNITDSWCVTKLMTIHLSLVMTKCVLGSFRPGQTQTGLGSHRS